MDFLTQNDFTGILSAGVITKLGGGFDEAESLAVSELDPLRGKFNVDAELAKDGANRNATLVRIMVHITAYYLYNTVPDDEIPQRIIDNWKKELATIEKIAGGKINSTLETLTSDTGKTITMYRWGSNKTRSHELYPRAISDEEAV